MRDGVRRDLTIGRTRIEATEHVIALAADSPETVVRLNFAFSLPRWWLEEDGFASADRVWEWAAERAAGDPAGWLKKLPPPFWGTSFRARRTSPR